MVGRARRHASRLAVLGLAAVLLAACGDDGDTATPYGQPAGTAGEKVTLEIVSPSDGAEVGTPFEVTVDSNVEIGPRDEELHHLHVWFGENQDDFDLYESATAQIANAPGGDLTMWVQVHTFDHQPASDPRSVALHVERDTGGNDAGGSSDY